MASRVDDIMANVGLPNFRRFFGEKEPVIYSESVDVTTWAMFLKSADTVGQHVGRFEPRLIAELPVADVPDPTPGDALEVGGVEYRVDMALDSDGYTVKVALRTVG